MFKKLTLAGAAFAMGAAALVPATPAMAQRYDRGYSYDRYDRGYNNNYRSYRGNDRRYYNNRRSDRCNDTGGTVVGAVAGGVLGNVVAGRGDRTLGTILGGAIGALAGREIDRGGQPGYCRRYR